MNKTDCPGLKWRKRKDGTRVPVWCAPTAAVKAGFGIRTWNMSWCAPEDLPTRCQAIWAEALDFVRRRRIGPTWACIDENLIFEITPSKTERTTGRRVRVDLKLCPFVMRASIDREPIRTTDH